MDGFSHDGRYKNILKCSQRRERTFKVQRDRQNQRRSQRMQNTKDERAKRTERRVTDIILVNDYSTVPWSPFSPLGPSFPSLPGKPLVWGVQRWMTGHVFIFSSCLFISALDAIINTMPSTRALKDWRSCIIKTVDLWQIKESLPKHLYTSCFIVVTVYEIHEVTARLRASTIAVTGRRLFWEEPVRRACCERRRRELISHLHSSSFTPL